MYADVRKDVFYLTLGKQENARIRSARRKVRRFFNRDSPLAKNK